MIEFRALGVVDLRVRGGTGLLSVLTQPKRTALLAYLLLSRPHRSHRRDQLVALFWPEADTEHGRNSLRQAVHFLRRSLGETAIESRGEEELAAGEEQFWCDVAAFDDALDRGDPGTGLSLYRGELLPGLFVEGAPEFEHWLDAERARLTTRAVRAASQLSEAKERAGDAAAAVELGARALALAPADQALLRRHMQLLERLGDRAGAIACYETCTRHLLVEYELEAAPETRALAEAIRARHNLAVSGPPSPPEPAAAALGAGATSAPAVPAIPPPSAAARTSATAAGPRAPQGFVARHRRRFAFAGAAVLMVALPLIWFFRHGGVAVRGAEVIVAEAVNRTSARADADLGSVITEALRGSLQGSTRFQVLGNEEVRQLLPFMRLRPDTAVDRALAGQVALRAGIEVVIEPAIGTAGKGYVLTAELVAPHEQKTLASVQASAAGPEHLIDAIDQLSRRIRRTLGESLAQVRIAPSFRQVTTSSLDAYRKYIRAARGGVADWDQFETLLSDAIKLDPSFGTAYRTLGIQQHNHGHDLQAAAYNLTRAYELRDKLTEWERRGTIATYHALVTGDRTKALAGWHEYLDLANGNDSIGWVALEHLGNIYLEARDYARAAEYWGRREALADSVDPNNAYTQNRLADALGPLGRYEDVLRLADRLDSMGAYREADNMRIQVAYDQRGVRGVDSAVQAWLARGRAAGDTARRPPRGLLLLRGRFAEATRGASDDPVQRAMRELYVRQDGAAARRLVDSVVSLRRTNKLSAFDMPYDRVVTVLARSGDTQVARDLLTDFDTALTPAVRNMARAALWMERPRGELAYAEGRFADAVRHFRAGDSIAPCVSCMMPMLGRAYEAAGKPDSAAAAYGKYLARVDFLELPDDAWHLAFVLEHLAAVRERLGDPAGALACYARFTALWEHADEELQPRVRAARARLAALTAEGRTRLPQRTCGGL